MKNRKMFTTFIKSEQVGVCECCDKDIYSDRLFVDNNDKMYHYSCYNRMKKDSEGNE